MDEPPRDKPIFSFYGDNFMGSTDALDALARNGVRGVLFLHPPDAAELKGFAGCRAVGIAGESRSQSPEWMRGALPAVFESLRQIGAPVVQYKVRPTFDSSPEAGSIGCALEIGQDVLAVPFVPVAPAAPALRCHAVFGNLFAADGDEIYRTDLRAHLARQTSRKAALMDILALGEPDAGARLERAIEERPGAVLFDGLDAASVEKSAALIWESRRTPPTGSWRCRGVAPRLPGARSSTLCTRGFSGIRLNAAQLPRTGSNGPYQEAVLAKALRHLSRGHSVVLCSAPGIPESGEVPDRRALASEMGKLLRAPIARSGVHRAVVAGSDTCSRAVRELEIAALTVLAPLAPGVPLCQAFAKGARSTGLELAFKAGAMGSDKFFEEVLRGGGKVMVSFGER
jgi:uncharacterized protein YgbK (DUF1537 family)